MSKRKGISSASENRPGYIDSRRAQLLQQALKDNRCQWFLLCMNRATTTRPHSVLGDVPICQRCQDHMDAIERPH